MEVFVGTWRCLTEGCTEHGTGAQAEMDKAAQKHVDNNKTHSTTISSRMIEVSDR